MAIVSGHGGYFSFFPTDFEELTNDPTILDVETWVGNWACDYMPCTPSGSGNGTLYLPNIGTNTWQVTFPLDSDQFTENDGSAVLQPGMSIYEAFFRRGNEDILAFVTFDMLERTTVTDVQMVNDNKGDALRVIVSGMGGRLTQGVLV